MTYKSLEREVEETWYPTNPHVVPIIKWWEADAPRDFYLDYENIRYPEASGVGMMGGRIEWLKKAKAAKRLIRSRVVEALFSPSAYLREYGRLLLEGKKL